MRVESAPAGLEALRGAEIFNCGHLPAAAAFCRRLGVVQAVNDLVPSGMAVSPGVMVQAMVLDTLSGRSPLYRINEFMQEQDVELLLGEDLPAKAFSDINVGRSLDALFKAGPAKIVTALGVRATGLFALDASVPSYDTTSTNVWGAYRACEAELPPSGSRLTWGYSKDHRPDLKQFMTELLCVDGGVPIFGRNLDGNSSDKKSNNAILARISSIMAEHGLGPGAFVYVADSAMVTEENLQGIGPNRFVTRLPATYKQCECAIRKAVESGTWTQIGRLAAVETGDSRPCALYKAFETTVVLYEKEYRAVVIHSSSHDKRRQKKYDRSVAQSRKSIEETLRKTATVYACEPDAKAAAALAQKLSDGLHAVSATVRSVEARKPGRPPKNAPAATATRYELEWAVAEDAEGVAQLKQLAGCFVLLANVPAAGEGAMDSASLLRTYKGQYSVENDFAFLKDPLVVNDIFLKTPSRIDALGMILIIALMIWRLMERSMRTYVKNTGILLPGWCSRPTASPTSFMMFTAMTGITVAKIGGKRTLLRAPTQRPEAFLRALGLDSNVFLDPACRCIPIIPAKTG